MISKVITAPLYSWKNLLRYFLCDWSCAALRFVWRAGWSSLMIWFPLTLIAGVVKPGCKLCGAPGDAVFVCCSPCLGPLLGVQRKSSFFVCNTALICACDVQKFLGKNLDGHRKSLSMGHLQKHTVQQPVSSFLSLPSSLENRMILYRRHLFQIISLALCHFYGV